MFLVSCNNSSSSKNPKNNTSNPNPNYKPPIGNEKQDVTLCYVILKKELN